MKQLRVQIHTWNVVGLSSIDENSLTRLFNFHEDIDLYVLSFQEIATGVVETALSFISYDGWTRTLLSILSKHGYFLVENVRLQGMSLSLFARYAHLPYIRFVKTDLRRTGLGGNWGNKGGIAISSNIYGKRTCFLNTHLPAHPGFNEARVEHFEDIIEFVEFDGTATILSHDVVFWAGDLNFRIDEIPRDVILKLIEEKNYSKLLGNDQLKQHLIEHDVMKQFEEAPITFPPSYKFDMGTDTYDTSEKQRKPAWTDRILHRINPDGRTLSDALRDISIATASPTSSPVRKNPRDLVSMVEGSYKSLAYMKDSDHKPVTAQYVMNISKTIEPLVEVRVVNEWNSDKDGDVVIRYHKNMKSDGSDYLALYEAQFTDFRSYKTWVHVPMLPQDTPEDPQRCKFPTPSIQETSHYRIGYYCNRMSCLLALTEPFTIRLC